MQIKNYSKTVTKVDTKNTKFPEFKVSVHKN